VRSSCSIRADLRPVNPTDAGEDIPAPFLFKRSFRILALLVQNRPGCEFTRNNIPQRRQGDLNCVPHQLRRHILVIVTIDIPCAAMSFQAMEGIAP
jgi:hypothetical protein